MDSNLEDFSIIKEKYQDKIFLRLVNFSKIDLYNAQELAEIFKQLNQEGSFDMAIDLSNINHIDSSGLSLLAKQGNLLRERKKKLGIVSPAIGVNHLFLVTGFDRFFQIYPDKESFLL